MLAGMSGVMRLDVHHLKGRLWGRICVWHVFQGKEGETVKGSFQPLFSRISREYDYLSIFLKHGGPHLLPAPHDYPFVCA